MAGPQRHRRCRNPKCGFDVVPIPGHPPDLHPGCAPITGDWATDSWHLSADWARMVEQYEARSRMRTATAFLVCGGRGYADREHFRSVLRWINPAALLKHGGARGADIALATLWEQRGGQTEAFTVNFRDPCMSDCPPRPHRVAFEDGTGDYCPLHGPRRNRAMAASGGDFLVAFPGGDGTQDMVRAAQAARIPVWIAPEPLRRPEKRTFAKPTNPRRAA